MVGSQEVVCLSPYIARLIAMRRRAAVLCCLIRQCKGAYQRFILPWGASYTSN